MSANKEASVIAFPGPAATPKERLKLPPEVTKLPQLVEGENCSPGAVAEGVGVTVTPEAATVFVGA